MFTRSLVLAFLILTGLSTLLQAQTRHALVIGNDAYDQVAGLQKAVNDAEAMGDTLDAMGFRVTKATNVTRRAMNRAIQSFVSQIGPGDVAMLFYAGHGIEIEGQNYLLPTDVPLVGPGQEGFVREEAIALNTILDRITERKARLNIVILDACRDNPFAGSNGRSVGATRGLARVNAPTGTFVMYSADAGEAALDRLEGHDPDPNSVFTRTLIPLMQTPGMDLVRIARETRRKVSALAKAARHQQTPAYYDAVLGDFYFSQPASQPVKQPSQGIDAAFAAANSINSDTVWTLFLDQYGTENTFYAAVAKDALSKLQPAPVRPQKDAPKPVPFAADRQAGLQCRWRDDILRLADLVLEKAPDTGTIRNRRYGTLAASLKLNYSQAGYEEGAALFNTLVGRHARDSKAALSAWTTHWKGPEAGLKIHGSNLGEAMVATGYFDRRALLLADEGLHFLTVLRSLRDQKTLPDLFDGTFNFGAGLPILVSDQSENFRTAFAKNAETTGELILAASILAQNEDRGPFDAFIKRHSDHELLMQFSETAFFDVSGHTAGRSDGPLAPGFRWHSVYRAVQKGGQESPLFTIINLSGQMAEGQLVAEDYLAALPQAGFDPVAETGRASVLVYEKLVAIMGADQTTKTLGQFDWMRSRHYSGLAIEVLDVMVALEAFRVAAEGGAPVTATPPALLHDKASWTSWRKMDRRARNDTLFTDTFDKAEVVMGVEILFAAGQPLEAARFAAQLTLNDQVRVAQDLMIRLDRRCAGTTVLPGQSLLLGGMNFVDFSQLSRS